MIRNRIRLDLDGFEDSKNNTGRKKKTIHALDRSGSGGGVMYIILNNMEGCRS